MMLLSTTSTRNYSVLIVPMELFEERSETLIYVLTLLLHETLAVNRRHLLLGITRPGHILWRERRVEPGHLLVAE